jgi:hypothetical protein
MKTYKWEKEALEKYGKEVTESLIKSQKRYEEKHKDNECNHCGKGNEGAIIEWTNDKKEKVPFIMHYGLWSNRRCNFCGEFDDDME